MYFIATRLCPIPVGSLQPSHCEICLTFRIVNHMSNDCTALARQRYSWADECSVSFWLAKPSILRFWLVEVLTWPWPWTAVNFLFFPHGFSSAVAFSVFVECWSVRSRSLPSHNAVRNEFVWLRIVFVSPWAHAGNSFVLADFANYKIEFDVWH